MGTGICPFCGKKVDKFIMFRGDIVGCRYCGIHTKQTNADRIRAMTDEELANWLEQFASCELCPAIRERCGYGDGCVKAWLDWLKQEVE